MIFSDWKNPCHSITKIILDVFTVQGCWSHKCQCVTERLALLELSNKAMITCLTLFITNSLLEQCSTSQSIVRQSRTGLQLPYQVVFSIG